MQSGYPSASMSMANYIDDEAAVQVTEELRELTIANYHRDRSPQVLVSVSDSAQPTSLEAYLNHSGKYTHICESRWKSANLGLRYSSKSRYGPSWGHSW